MSEDEATEKLKQLVAKCKECKFATCENCEINWNEVQAIETILNELKTYKQLYISTLGHSLNNSIKQNNDLEALNEGWKIELEKKDKIIDAMAKEWFELDSLFMIRGKNIHSEKELKQYFERRAEDE